MSEFEFGPYRLDVRRRVITLDGVPLPLGPKVVLTLAALVERAGDVVSKEDVLERVWPGEFVEESNLSQNVYVLRKTFSRDWNVRPIVTVPRRGYRFVAPVRAVDPTPPAQLPRVKRFTVVRDGGFRPGALLFAAFLVVVTIVGANGSSHVPPLSSAGAQHYALGRYYWNQRTPAGLLRSLRYFESVVRSDPHNPLGYSGEADAYVLMPQYGVHAVSSPVAFAKARANAVRALALDPGSAAAHASLGNLLQADGSPAAETEFRRAIALDPTYAPAHHWLGIALFNRARVAAASEEFRTAERLDPVSPAIEVWLGIADYFARRYGDSLEHSRRALEIDPQRSDAYAQLGMTYDQTGDYGRALAAYDHLARTGTDVAAVAVLRAHVYARMGHAGEARRVIASVKPGTLSDGELREGVALTFIALGERDQALALLRMQRMKDRMDAARLALDPRLDPVRDDARFRAWTRLDPS